MGRIVVPLGVCDLGEIQSIEWGGGCGGGGSQVKVGSETSERWLDSGLIQEWSKYVHTDL